MQQHRVREFSPDLDKPEPDLLINDSSTENTNTITPTTTVSTTLRLGLPPRMMPPQRDATIGVRYKPLPNIKKFTKKRQRELQFEHLKRENRRVTKDMLRTIQVLLNGYDPDLTWTEEELQSTGYKTNALVHRFFELREPSPGTPMVWVVKGSDEREEEEEFLS